MTSQPAQTKTAAPKLPDVDPRWLRGETEFWATDFGPGAKLVGQKFSSFDAALASTKNRTGPGHTVKITARWIVGPDGITGTPEAPPALIRAWLIRHPPEFSVHEPSRDRTVSVPVGSKLTLVWCSRDGDPFVLEDVQAEVRRSVESVWPTGEIVHLTNTRSRTHALLGYPADLDELSRMPEAASMFATAAADVPLAKTAGELIPLGKARVYSAEIWADGKALHQRDFATLTAAKGWALPQVKPGETAALIWADLREKTDTEKAARQAQLLGPWPASGFLELPAGTHTEVRWVSRDGHTLEPARTKVWDLTDRYSLNDAGLPQYFDTDEVLRKQAEAVVLPVKTAASQHHWKPHGQHERCSHCGAERKTDRWTGDLVYKAQDQKHWIPTEPVCAEPAAVPEPVEVPKPVELPAEPKPASPAPGEVVFTTELTPQWWDDDYGPPPPGSKIISQLAVPLTKNAAELPMRVWVTEVDVKSDATGLLPKLYDQVLNNPTEAIREAKRQCGPGLVVSISPNFSERSEDGLGWTERSWHNASDRGWVEVRNHGPYEFWATAHRPKTDYLGELLPTIEVKEINRWAQTNPPLAKTATHNPEDPALPYMRGKFSAVVRSGNLITHRSPEDHHFTDPRAALEFARGLQGPETQVWVEFSWHHRTSYFELPTFCELRFESVRGGPLEKTHEEFGRVSDDFGRFIEGSEEFILTKTAGTNPNPIGQLPAEVRVYGPDSAGRTELLETKTFPIIWDAFHWGQTRIGPGYHVWVIPWFWERNWHGEAEARYWVSHDEAPFKEYSGLSIYSPKDWGPIIEKLQGVPYERSALYSRLGAAAVPLAKTASLTLYHGRPHDRLADDFSNFNDRVLFFTADPEVATQYARSNVPGAGKTTRPDAKVPTVYKCQVNPAKTVDFRLPEIQQLYEQHRNDLVAQSGDLEDRMPKLTSEGFIMSRTRLPGFGRSRMLAQMFAPLGFDSMWIDEGSQGLSLMMWDWAGKVKTLEKIPVGKTAVVSIPLQKTAMPDTGTMVFWGEQSDPWVMRHSIAFDEPASAWHEAVRHVGPGHEVWVVHQFNEKMPNGYLIRRKFISKDGDDFKEDVGDPEAPGDIPVIDYLGEFGKKNAASQIPLVKTAIPLVSDTATLVYWGERTTPGQPLHSVQKKSFDNPAAAWQEAMRHVGPGQEVLVSYLFDERMPDGKIISREFTSRDGGDFEEELVDPDSGGSIPVVPYLGEIKTAAAQIPLNKTAKIPDTLTIVFWSEQLGPDTINPNSSSLG